MCLPRGTTSVTVAPVRSTVASCGTRSSPRRSVAPASAVFIRWAASQTVSPSGTPTMIPGVGGSCSPVGRRHRARPQVGACCERGDNGNRLGSGGAAGYVTVSMRLRSLTGGPAEQPVAEPVTVTVARGVRPEQQDAFESWAAEIQELLATFPGSLGSSLLRPGAGSNEFHLVFRFTDDESLSNWERSPERAEALARVHRLAEDTRTARAVGLESFFAVPARPGPAWRSWLLTVTVVLALTSTFQLVAVPFIGSWPWGLRLLLSAVYVVSALRVLMPRLSRRLGPWLQGRNR